MLHFAGITKLTHTLILVVMLMLACSAWGASVLPVGPDWRHKPQGLAQVQVDEIVYDGARAQVARITARARPEGSRQNDAITQNITLDLTHCQSLTFKARLQAAGQSKPSFTLTLKGKNLSLKHTLTPDRATGQAKEGFLTFEIKLPASQPRIEGATLTLTPDYAALAGQDTMSLEIIDLVFQLDPSAMARPAGNPVQHRQWVSSNQVTHRDLPASGWQVASPEQASSVTIESTTVEIDGKALPATVFRFKPAQKGVALILPISADVDKENVLTFLARVQPPAESKQLGTVEAPMTGWFSYRFNQFADNFGVGFEDPDGFRWSTIGVPSTHFLQHVESLEPDAHGLRRFKWDIVHDNPTGNKGFDRRNVSRLVLFYNASLLEEGQETTITLIAPQLVTGLMHTGGDMARFARFNEAMKQYQPDFSDSSHYLEPPAQGRLDSPLPLVRQGQAVGEIVGKSSVWSPQGNGIIELYQWLYKLTDGTLVPVVDKPTAADNTKIFVGTSHARELFPQDIEALKGSDGAAIRTRGKNVYLFGATPKGTLNAVYIFLEGNTDIIWPQANEAFEAVYTSSPDLDIRWGDYLHRPRGRNWGWMGETQGPQLMYQVRNRANYVGLRSAAAFKYWGLYREEGGGHNLHSWIPFSLFKTHPEYWAMIDGKRQHPNGYKNQICLSNPDGRRIFLTRLREAIDRNPVAREADCYNIKIEDNWGVCECEECTRPIRLPDGSLLPADDIAFRSTQFFMFLNAVANHLHNTGLPRMQIGTYVYFYTVPVPRVPVTTALRPYFCPYVRKDHKAPIYAPINDIWWRIANQWASFNPNVVMREYTGLFVFLRPLADVAKHDIDALMDIGVYEFTSERLTGGALESPAMLARDYIGIEAAAVEYWVINRLYWNPKDDVQQLRKYYLRRAFREAAPAMEQFYALAREIHYGEARTSDFEENHEIIQRAIVLGKDAQLREYLAQAQAQVRHPVSKRMLKTLVERYLDWEAQARALLEKQRAG